jgi:hypothetical protein
VNDDTRDAPNHPGAFLHQGSAYINERQALDRLVDATQRLANAEALSRFLHTFPSEGFRPPPTITRESALAEIKARGIG